MTEISMSVNVELVKYFKRKKDKKICISKQPIYLVDAECDYCREVLCRNIYDRLVEGRVKHGTELKPTKSDHYYLVPEPILKLDDKVYVPRSDIVLDIGELGQNDSFKKYSKDDVACKRVFQIMDYTLGIVNVLLSGNDKERQRMDYLSKNKTPLHSHGLGREDYESRILFHYGVLSPWFMTSSITVSLVFAMARDAFNVANHQTDLVEELLNSVDYDTIKDIIKHNDIGHARRIYNTKLKPIYSKRRNTDNILGASRRMGVLEHLMEQGVDKVFKPFGLVNYWWNEDIFEDGCFGFESFVNAILSNGMSYGDFTECGND
jgi:hypothetical protein